MWGGGTIFTALRSVFLPMSPDGYIYLTKKNGDKIYTLSLSDIKL